MGPTVLEGAAQVRCVCTCLLCDVEEVLSKNSLPRAIVRLRRPSGPGRRRTPWTFRLTTAYVFVPTVIRIGADGSPEDMISCVWR